MSKKKKEGQTAAKTQKRGGEKVKTILPSLIMAKGVLEREMGDVQPLRGRPVTRKKKRRAAPSIPLVEKKAKMGPVVHS